MALKPDAWDRSLKPDAGDRSLYRSERQTQGDRRTPPDQARRVCPEHLAVPVRPQLVMCGSLATPVRVVCTACAGRLHRLCGSACAGLARSACAGLPNPIRRQHKFAKKQINLLFIKEMTSEIREFPHSCKHIKLYKISARVEVRAGPTID